MSQKLGRRRREAAQRVVSVNPWNSLDVLRQQLGPYERALRLDVEDLIAERNGASCDSLESAPNRFLDVAAHRAAGQTVQPMPWGGERRPFDRDALPQAWAIRPDHLFEECYLQALNFNTGGGRVMHVGDGLVQQMAATDNNAPCGDFRLPFNSFVLTTRSETLARLYLNGNAMLADVNPRDVSISVMVSIGISVEGVRRLALVTHASIGGRLVGMANARIALMLGTVRDAVADFLDFGRTTPVEVAQPQDEGVDPEDLNWLGNGAAGYYLTLVNVLLYLTTPASAPRRVAVSRAIPDDSAEVREVDVAGEGIEPLVLEPGRLVAALVSGARGSREFRVGGRVMTRGHWRSRHGQASLPDPEQQWIRPYWRNLDGQEKPQRPYAVQQARTGR